MKLIEYLLQSSKPLTLKYVRDVKKQYITIYKNSFLKDFNVNEIT